MRRIVLETLACYLIVIAWVLAGCSSAAKGPRIAECLVGPDPKQDPVCDGEVEPWGTVPFPGSPPIRYVCHRLDDHEAYRERCEH
jgi:hypothetical protein